MKRFSCFLFLALLWSGLTLQYWNLRKVESPTSSPSFPFPTGEVFYVFLDSQKAPQGVSKTLYVPQKDKCLVRHTSYWKLPWLSLLPRSSSLFESRASFTFTQKGQVLFFTLSILFTLQGKRQKITLEGTPIRSGFLLNIRWGRQKFRRKIPFSSLFLGESIGFLPLGNRNIGDTWRTASPTGEVYEFTLLKKELYLFQGKKEPAFLVEIRRLGSPAQPMRAWISQEGLAYEVRHAKGLIRRVSKREYKTWKQKLFKELGNDRSSRKSSQGFKK